MKKIVKQLRREAAANPKKAWFLGLLGVVALWFWVPLAASWIAPDDPSAESSAAASPSEPAVAMPLPSSPGMEPEVPAPPRHPWQRLIQWMDNDARAWATRIPYQRRDPFVATTSQIDEEPDEAAVAEELPAPVDVEVTPESLGMVLSSTIVGPGNGLARIGGELYPKGKEVVFEKDGREIKFLLAEVHPRHVVLQRQGKRFELRIPVPAHAGRIEVYRDGN